MRRIKDKILPSAIFIAIVVICFASVHTFNIDRQLCYRKGSIWSKSATNAISTTKIYGLKSPVPLPLNAHRSTKTEMMTAVMDSAVVSSFLSFAKGSVNNLKGISIKGIISTFRAEVSREVAILFYAPMKRKAIFLLHPVAMILFIVSMSRLIPLMIEGVKKVGSTSVSMATDFSVSVSDARKKAAEKVAAARQSRVESLALAAAAAATASTLKKEKDALIAIEKAKKLAVAKAMKEEDERLATETVKAKAEERARLNLENNEKKMKAQRLAVEQAAIRQEEMVRLAKEKKLQQVRETEAKVAQVQARKEEQNRVLAEQKAAREESSRVLVAKKEEQMRLQAETKERKVRTELNLKAEKQALLNYQAKVAEDARQQVLAKQRATDQSRLAQTKENENRVKREKKERDELLAQQLVLKAMEDIERANARAEEDRIQAAERALKVEEEKKALAAMNKRKEEDVRAAKEMKKRVENEALMAVQKERELQLMKTKSEKLEKKWGPAVLVGITPEPVPWLQKTSSALSVRALITKAREVELAEDARAAENERSIAKAKADIEYARNKAIALAAQEASEAVRLEALRIEAVKKEALPQPLPLPVPLSDLTHISSVAVSDAVTITVTIDAAVTSTMTHTITEASTSPEDLVLATVPDTDLDPDGNTRTAATITAAILGFKVLGPFGALAGATFANHYVNKNDMNGQVVRTIGKTTVGSIDLMKSVDSKFEIVRSVEKALKEAVSSNKKAQSAINITAAVPGTNKSTEVIDESIRHSKQASSSSSSSSSSSPSPSSSTSSLSSIRALAKNLIKKI